MQATSRDIPVGLEVSLAICVSEGNGIGADGENIEFEKSLRKFQLPVRGFNVRELVASPF
jgi:hypothetical protein